LDRLCKEDESEWEENVHARRMIEIRVKVWQAFLADGNEKPTTSASPEQSVNELFDGYWNGRLSSYGNVLTAGMAIRSKNLELITSRLIERLAAFGWQARRCAVKVWSSNHVDIITTNFPASLALVLS
jgi:hypothetical protein